MDQLTVVPLLMTNAIGKSGNMHKVSAQNGRNVNSFTNQTNIPQPLLEVPSIGQEETQTALLKKGLFYGNNKVIVFIYMYKR